MNVNKAMAAEHMNAEWIRYIDDLNGKYEEGLIDDAKYRRLSAKLIAWEDVAVQKGLIRIG